MESRTLSNEIYPDGVINAGVSAVTWSAIIAGALVAAATTLLLTFLGTGVDLASISPWPGSGVSATSAVVMTAIGLIVIQWMSAAMGGYITGRLRTKWVGTHTHEVFFRDTAHGFISWALATLLAASALASAASSLIGAGAHGAAAVATGVSSAMRAGAGNGIVQPYDLDMLLRSASPDSKAGPGNDTRAQLSRILEKGLVTGDVPATDRTYAAQIVAAQTGVPQEEAQRRVDDAITQTKAAEVKAREVADAARKDGALSSIFTALSMLVGAFIASVSAALGGRLRDLHP
jgi:hypothetical protein